MGTFATGTADMVPALQPAEAPAPNEHSIHYPGWRIALASSACVLVSFASLFGDGAPKLAAICAASEVSICGP